MRAWGALCAVVRQPSRSAGAKHWRAALRRGALLMPLALVMLALGAARAIPPHAVSLAASRWQVPTISGVSPASLASLAALSVMTSRPEPPAICVPLAPGPRMWTPAQLASPRLPGRTYDARGEVRPCFSNQLVAPAPAGGVPHLHGQVILVSLSQQWLWAYQDGTLVFANPVTTGQPSLPTPLGEYHVQTKIADTTFYSPWGPWSPYYYAPEHVNFALLFRAKGYFLHDASWRQAFGPGTNSPHSDPGGAQETGSHGCVNMTTAAAEWLYRWAEVGATVLIVS